MKILSLETSTQPGGLALLDDDRIIFETTFPDGLRTTQSFAPAMAVALREFGRPATALDLFAVCDGPGSFTGLRIGVTCAKTFAYAMGVAVVACDSLHVIASQLTAERSPVWSVMYAQRDQVFATLLVDGKPLVPTCILDASEWLSRVGREEIVTGPGLKRYRDRLAPEVTVADEALWMPRAVSLAKFAAAAYKSGQRADVWSLTPKYYRKSAAEESKKQSE